MGLVGIDICAQYAGKRLITVLRRAAPGGLAARTVLGEICVAQMIGAGDGNGLLAAEIAVDGHRRQIGVLGDLGDGGLVNALGEEAPLCRPNDGGAVLLAQLLLGHKAPQLSDSITIYL